MVPSLHQTTKWRTDQPRPGQEQKNFIDTPGFTTHGVPYNPQATVIHTDPCGPAPFPHRRTAGPSDVGHVNTPVEGPLHTGPDMERQRHLAQPHVQGEVLKQMDPVNLQPAADALQRPFGDQLILEEDYDENYIPSEQEVHDFARQIGIDPEREPELLWLAREVAVAPLPPEWKPCQDVTGEVYYFNFSTGQSTWDHPCDEHYRQLVAQERERAHHGRTASAISGSASTGTTKNKEKKKKKKKKEKKKKEPEGLKAPRLLAPLAPLRGMCDLSVPGLRGSLGNSTDLHPLKSSLGDVSGANLHSLRGRQLESLAPPIFNSDLEVDEEEDEEQKAASVHESLLGSSDLLQNIHLDLDILKGGLQYEDSEVSGSAPVEERSEPERQDLTPLRDHSPDPPLQSQDEKDGEREEDEKMRPQVAERMMLEPSSPPSSSSLSKPSGGLQEPLKNNSALCWLRPETVRGTASRSSVAEETELDVEEEKTKREEECVCVCECGQLSGLLQEVREEVQREHSRKLEQLSQEHQEQLLTLRHEHLEEESVERERLLRAHLEEKERMQDSHTSQLEQLRLQLDSQLQHTHKTHMQKELEVQKMMEQLDMKSKELKSQELLLQTQATDLKKRRQQLSEEEDDVEKGIEALSRVLRERDSLRAELDRLRDERKREREELEKEREGRRREREESRRIMEEREKLLSNTVLLQDRCDELHRRLSEAEQREHGDDNLERKKQEEGKEKSREKEGSLGVEEMEPPLSPVPTSHNNHSSIDDLQEYISCEGVSLQRARQFLEKETSCLRARQAALRTAHPSPQRSAAGGSAQLLCQEVSEQEKLRETVQKDHTLLRKKEERLSQLETSLAEELSCDEGERLVGDRRVSFDVRDSETSRDEYGQEETTHAVPVKVQQLAEYLQQISGQLNTVLGALGSLTGRTVQPLPQPPPSSSFPPAPSWAWTPSPASSSLANQNSFLHCSVPKTHGSDLHLNSHWSKLFPGVSMDTSARYPMRATRAYSGYTPASLSSELDSQRLQRLIEDNKRWLESQRKDPNVPLFTRYPAAPPTNGLVQLGLDENNQIKVYHYRRGTTH
ncbi:uncharacterized protein LOC143501976 isoform X3 [Brachyhypopomus gauderio]|uniref:uncharacterized protein LOC143501976 isoform X3 n=1 Tax=Brachyhypopomus gauderio TaxID=698409 RepID=UPI004042A714